MSEQPAEKISCGRVVLLLLSLAAGVVAAKYGRPLVHGNELAANIIVTTFTVLAGFLVAIMAILGDPGGLLPGSWRIASAQRRALRRKMLVHKYLFYAYLATIALVFGAAMLKGLPPELSANHWIKRATEWTERLYAGFAVTGLIWSFALPGSLMRLNEQRVDAVIEARRNGQSDAA